MTCIHTLRCNQINLFFLILIWISEINTCKWSTSSWVMNDLLNYSLNISMTLSIIIMTIQWVCHSLVLMCFKNTISLTLSLCFILYIIINKISFRLFQKKKIYLEFFYPFAFINFLKNNLFFIYFFSSFFISN